MTLLTIVAVAIVVVAVVVGSGELHSRLFVSRRTHRKAVTAIDRMQQHIDGLPIVEPVDEVDEDAVVLEALQELSGMLQHNAQFGLRFLSDMGLPQGQGVVGFLKAYVESLPKQNKQNKQNNNGKKNTPAKPEPKTEAPTYPVQRR